MGGKSQNDRIRALKREEDKDLRGEMGFEQKEIPPSGQKRATEHNHLGGLNSFGFVGLRVSVHILPHK